MKPRIRWWGNGDVHADCFNAYRRCYPNSIATFRTEPQNVISYTYAKLKYRPLDFR